MGRGPRQLGTPADLYAAAVGALARRAHSAYEMRQLLERRAADRAQVAPVLGKLKSEGLLDDARYARQFARARAEGRRQGRYRIARELRARGVADRFIEAALAELGSETDEGALLRRRIEIWLRRHAGATLAAPGSRQLGSLYRSLLRAGFPGDRIRDEFRRLGRGGELPGNDAGDD